MNEQEWLECSDPVRMLAYLLEVSASSRKLRLFACACVSDIDSMYFDDRIREAMVMNERYADGEISEADFENVVAEATTVATEKTTEKDDAESEEEEAERNAEKASAAARLAEEKEKAAWGPGNTWEEGNEAERLAKEAREREDYWQFEAIKASDAADEARAAAASAEAAVLALTGQWQECVEQMLVTAVLLGEAEDRARSWARFNLYDIFGNPFQPMPQLSETWRQENKMVIDVAEFIYKFLSIGDTTAWDEELSKAEFTREELWKQFFGLLSEAGLVEDHPICEHLRSTRQHVEGCWALDLLLGK